MLHLPPTRLFQIRSYHLRDHLLERVARPPLQLLSSLRRITTQHIYLSRAEIARIHGYYTPPRPPVKAPLLDTGAFPPQVDTYRRKRLLAKRAHGVGLTGGQHVVVRFVLLEHPPHALDEIAGVPPVALGVEIAQIQPLLQSYLDPSRRARDLARDESLSADGRLVVEQDAVAGKEVVGFAVVDGDPIGVELGDPVRAAGVEGCVFVLGHLLRFAVEFAGRGLVEAYRVGQAEDAEGLQQAQRPEGIGVGGVLRCLEADLHVALSPEVVDLVGLNLLDNADEVGRISQVAVVQEEADVFLVRILVEMIDALGVEEAAAPLDAMDLVVFLQEQFGQVRPVLARYSSYQCTTSFHALGVNRFELNGLPLKPERHLHRTIASPKVLFWRIWREVVSETAIRYALLSYPLGFEAKVGAYLVGLNLLDNADEVGRISQVAVVQEEADVFLVRILVEMIDALGVEEAAAPLDAMDLVVFLQEQFGQVRPVLARYSSYQCTTSFHALGVNRFELNGLPLKPERHLHRTIASPKVLFWRIWREVVSETAIRYALLSYPLGFEAKVGVPGAMCPHPATVAEGFLPKLPLVLAY